MRIIYSILETRKWSTKKEKLFVQIREDSAKENFLNIILFVFHKGLFCQLDTHVVMISIAMISGNWNMEDRR